jgi:hypothetical protein
MHVTHDIGSTLEDGKDAAEKELTRLLGIPPVLDQAAKLVEDLCQGVNKDIDDGNVPGGDPLEVGAYAKKYIFLAKAVLTSASDRAEKATLRAQGRLEAMETVVKNIKKMHDEEKRKLQAELARLEALGKDDGKVVGIRDRAPGQHPGPSLKEQRRIEAAKPETKPVRKKRGRPRKEKPTAAESTPQESPPTASQEGAEVTRVTGRAEDA